MKIGYLAISILFGLLLAGVSLVNHANAREARPISDREREFYLAKHREITERLMEAGLPRRETPDWRFGETPILRAMTPSNTGSPERIMVDDAFIGMSFNRNSRELISLGNRGLSSWRGRESEKESRFDFDMTKERAHELMSKYMTAIEGGFPERLGGLDEDRFTSMAERAKTDGGRISTRADISATWPRTHEGVPFFSIDDSTWISICAVTGELMVYKKERRSLPPEEMEVNITQEEALKMAKDITAEEIRFKARIDPDNIRIDTEGRLFASIAAYEEALEQKREYLKEEAKYWLVYTGIEPQLDGEPELMIVNPNIAYTEGYRNDSPLKDRWNPQTKLAWVITLTYTPADEDEQRLRPLKMMVWIEAADGEVIGGELPY